MPGQIYVHLRILTSCSSVPRRRRPSSALTQRQCQSPLLRLTRLPRPLRLHTVAVATSLRPRRRLPRSRRSLSRSRDSAAHPHAQDATRQCHPWSAVSYLVRKVRAGTQHVSFVAAKKPRAAGRRMASLGAGRSSIVRRRRTEMVVCGAASAWYVVPFLTCSSFQRLIELCSSSCLPLIGTRPRQRGARPWPLPRRALEVPSEALRHNSPAPRPSPGSSLALAAGRTPR